MTSTLDASAWWLANLRANLSQGDVIDLAVVARVEGTSLAKATIGKGRPGWIPTDEPGEFWLAKGKLRPAIVLSHSCELDKPKSTSIVHVAAMRSVEELNAAERQDVLDQLSHHRLVLPDVPSLGATYYADLRSATALRRDLVDKATRVASLTEAGTQRLLAQIVAFFTRLQAPPEGFAIEPDE